MTALVLAPVGAFAAPLQADAPASAAETGGRGFQPSAGGPSRTVDLLIELQPRSAGIEFNERSGRGSSDRGVRPPAAPAVAPLGTATRPVEAAAVQAPPPGGLFGAGAVPQAPARKITETEWQRQPTRASSEAPADSTRRSDSSSDNSMAQWLSLPRELINYLRENRNWVIGAGLGLLGLLWGGSIMMGRARR